MEKKIILEDGNIIFYKATSKDKDIVLNIDKYYLENGLLTKSISFTMGNNFNFNAWIIDNQAGANKVDFSFDLEDPLYAPLVRLLGDNQIITIDDDATTKNNINTMTIAKRDNSVLITFENKKENLTVLEKNNFNVFIKNIMLDYRSKADFYESNIKEKIGLFFETVNDMMKEDYHQITIDEYLKQKTLRKQIKIQHN